MKLRSPSRTKKVSSRIQSLFHDNDPVLGSRLEIIHTDPNIFLVHNFLTPAEILWMNKICTNHAKSFKSSFTQGENQDEVVSEERTSKFLQLSKSQDAVVRRVEERASDLVGLRPEYLEPLQIVSYSQGQYFRLHHDAGTLLDSGEVEPVEPRRLVTLFVYLNSLPKGQGHTEFPNLPLSVRPKEGCGVLFCNVLADGSVDPRTAHQACPITANLRKFGINVRP